MNFKRVQVQASVPKEKQLRAELREAKSRDSESRSRRDAQNTIGTATAAQKRRINGNPDYHVTVELLWAEIRAVEKDIATLKLRARTGSLVEA
jgi:hypothetical protein